MKQVQKNAVFVSVLSFLTLALGLYAYFGVVKKEEKETQKKEASQRLISMGEDSASASSGSPGFDVTVLSIEAKGDKTRLEKVNGEWHIVQPESALADQAAITQLVAQLQSAKVKSTIEEKPTDDDLTRYGLNPPRFSFAAIVSAPSQKREFKIHCGIENTYDGSVYLRREGDPVVYSADGSLRQALEKSFFDLRDKQIFNFDDNALTKLEVKAEKHGYSLVRSDAAAHWQVERPQPFEADDSDVKAMLSSLKGQSALSFPKDSPAFRKQVNLDSPKLTAQLTFGGGKTLTFRLATSKAEGIEKSYLLRSEGAVSTLSEIASTTLAILDKDPADLRNKRVLSFKPEDVFEIRVKLQGQGKPGQEIRAKKTVAASTGAPEAWDLTAPKQGPVQRYRMSSVLWTLSNLQATRIAEENPKTLAKYGLDDDARGYTLLDKSGKQIASLAVGKHVEGQGQSIYVRGNKPTVFEIDSSRIASLPTSIDDLIEKAADGGASDAH